ncbi:MAG: hypothetical protein E6G56_08870 [Actinobacteria bacterium]|nr:MAG: hypothetical protein E6G56_08870 [Actinomycetota bacterium]
MRVHFAESRIPGGCSGNSVALAPPHAGHVAILTLGRLGNGIEVPDHPGRHSPPIPVARVRGSACHRLQGQRSDTNTNPEYEYRNPGETGLRALIASARHSIFISQQDMLSCVFIVEALFDERVFAALGNKVAHGIPIKIVLSAEDARAGGDSYSNKGHFLVAPVKQTAETLKKVVAKQQHIREDRARAMVCNDVSLATIRNSALPTWPNGSGYANHAKVVSVDDAAFYIGSQNLYPARLQELGLIVENPSASATLKHQYLDPLWGQSQGLAYIDPGRACGPF